MSDDRDWTPERCSSRSMGYRCDRMAGHDHKVFCEYMEENFAYWGLLAEARKEAEGLRERLAEAEKRLAENRAMTRSRHEAIDATLGTREDEITEDAAKRVMAELDAEKIKNEDYLAQIMRLTDEKRTSVNCTLTMRDADDWRTVALALALAGRKA